MMNSLISPFLTAVFLVTALVGCTKAHPISREPLSREKIVENLSPIVDMEQRGMKLTLAIRNLPLVTTVSPEDAHALKEAYDVYYVYHNAAATSLAEGDLQAYRDHVQAGSRELDSLEAKLQDILKGSSGGSDKSPAVPPAKSGSL